MTTDNQSEEPRTAEGISLASLLAGRLPDGRDWGRIVASIEEAAARDRLAPAPNRPTPPVGTSDEGRREAAIERISAVANGWTDALYGGVPGGRPPTDAGILLAVANMLDGVDDTRDEFVGSTADRSIQADLRRIAARLPGRDDSAPGEAER